MSSSFQTRLPDVGASLGVKNAVENKTKRQKTTHQKTTTNLSPPSEFPLLPLSPPSQSCPSTQCHPTAEQMLWAGPKYNSTGMHPQEGAQNAWVYLAAHAIPQEPQSYLTYPPPPSPEPRFNPFSLAELSGTSTTEFLIEDSTVGKSTATDRQSNATTLHSPLKTYEATKEIVERAQATKRRNGCYHCIFEDCEYPSQKRKSDF
jgi:hypothetical protein